MSSSSPTKTPSIPSRSSSQLSLDSHLSSPRKRQSKPSSNASSSTYRRSLDLSGSPQKQSSTAASNRRSHSQHDRDQHHANDTDQHHPAALSPHMRMVSGFAVNVGLGSPKLDFGRRDWAGPIKEGSAAVDRSPGFDFANAHHSEEGQEKGEGKGSGHSLIDRVSGLPSPPGAESDIAPPETVKPTDETDKMSRLDRDTFSATKSPPKPFRRTSSTGSAHLLVRNPSSRSSSSTPHGDSPRLQTHNLRPKHTPSPTKHSPSFSMSRSASSSSSLINSPLAGAKVNGNLTGSTRRSSLALSRTSSHSSSVSLGGQPGSFPRRGDLPPVNTQRANSSESQFSSPERTAKNLPPVRGDVEQLVERKEARRLSRGSDVEILAEEDEARDTSMSRSRSNGSELDNKIREAEERIAEAGHHRRRRSVDIGQKSTPVRAAIRRHDSYTRATGEPMLPSTSEARRNPIISSANISSQPDSLRGSSSRRDNFEREALEVDERERSGGSASSRKRKGLPENFRNSGLFTPSPQKPAGQDQTGSTRSARLQQLIDSPSDYTNSSPLPSRFSTSSRRSGEYQQASSSSRAHNYIDGLERSASMVGTRNGETFGYSKRNWSQSISGLPRASGETDQRGLPRDRFRAESVLGTNGDRSGYSHRASLDSSGADRTSSRRGMSTLVSERDLIAASRSRFGSIAPGDSVSAVGAKSERDDNKDPLDVIRRLEEQRAQAKKRWDHMPRSATSMSSLRESYNHPPNTAPIDGLRHRRSIDQDSPLSPTYARGSTASRIGSRGPATEPRPMRSSTSLGGRSSATLEFSAAASEHGRLLFEAFRLLDSKLGQEILTTQPELLRTLHSATRTSETINTSLRNALHLTSQIAVDAELDDPAKVREEYSSLALLLRDAGKASEQNVRDMTRVMLDLPKLFRQLHPQQQQLQQQQGQGSGMTASSSGGSSRLRRSESASLGYDPVKPGIMSEERARRWQPSSPTAPLDRSPLQGRWSVDTPRRSYDALRASTSVGDAYSPLSRYSRERENNKDNGIMSGREREKSGSTVASVVGGGSTVSALMSKVRAITPRKSMPSPKLDLSTIEASPPQLPKYSPTKSNARLSSSSSMRLSLSRSPEKEREKEKDRPRLPDLLKKKTSSISTHTIKGSNFFPSTSGGKATTAISQITAGDLDLSPSLASGSGIMADIVPDEPNSPMSRFSFRSQRSRRTSNVRDLDLGGGGVEGSPRAHNHDQDYETTSTDGDEGRGSYETDAISLLEQRLVQAAKAREGDTVGASAGAAASAKDKVGLGIGPSPTTMPNEYFDPHGHGNGNGNGNGEMSGDLKRPSLGDRFRASLRKG